MARMLITDLESSKNKGMKQREQDNQDAGAEDQAL